MQAILNKNSKKTNPKSRKAKSQKDAKKTLKKSHSLNDLKIPEKKSKSSKEKTKNPEKTNENLFTKQYSSVNKEEKNLSQQNQLFTTQEGVFTENNTGNEMEYGNVHNTKNTNPLPVLKTSFPKKRTIRNNYFRRRKRCPTN